MKQFSFFFHVRVERCCEAQLGQLASHPNEKTPRKCFTDLVLLRIEMHAVPCFWLHMSIPNGKGTITNLNWRYIFEWLVFPCHLGFPICQFRSFLGYSGCWTMDRKRDFVISTSQLEVMVSQMFFWYWPFFWVGLSDGLRPPPSCRNILSFLNWQDIDNCWWWPSSPA